MNNLDTYLSKDDQQLFRKIYEQNYFNDKTTPTPITVPSTAPGSLVRETQTIAKKPSLIEGIDLPILTPEEVAAKKYKDLTIGGISESSESKFLNGESAYYTRDNKANSFVKLLMTVTNQIESKVDDKLIPNMISKALENTRCNNKLKAQFQKFIITYTKNLAYNKALLLNEMEYTIYRALSFIYDCDFFYWESFSNKELEWVFSSIKNIGTSMGATATNIKRSLLKALSDAYTSGRHMVETLQPNTYTGQSYVIKKPDNTVEFTKKLEDIPDNEIQSIITNPTYIDEVIKIRLLAASVRTQIESLYILNKNKFCSYLEVANTTKKNPDDSFWFRTPAIVTSTIASINTTTAFSLSATQSTVSELSKSMLVSSAAFISTVLGPMLGLIVGLSLGTLMESEFYKNLRSSRHIYLKFREFQNNYTRETKRQLIRHETVCSYRKNHFGYVSNFESASKTINDYLEKAKINYDIESNNLEYYLYAYSYVCGIEPYIPDGMPNDDDAPVQPRVDPALVDAPAALVQPRVDDAVVDAPAALVQPRVDDALVDAPAPAPAPAALVQPLQGHDQAPVPAPVQPLQEQVDNPQITQREKSLFMSSAQEILRIIGSISPQTKIININKDSEIGNIIQMNIPIINGYLREYIGSLFDDINVYDDHFCIRPIDQTRNLRDNIESCYKTEVKQNISIKNLQILCTMITSKMRNSDVKFKQGNTIWINVGLVDLTKARDISAKDKGLVTFNEYFDNYARGGKKFKKTRNLRKRKTQKRRRRTHKRR